MFAGLVAIMLVVGIGIGMLIGPRLGRLMDSADDADTTGGADTADDDEGPGDDD